MNVYYSRTQETDDGIIFPHLKKFGRILAEMYGLNPDTYWHTKGDKYDTDMVKDADLVVVGVTEHKDGTTNECMGKGSYTELKRAFDLGIPVIVLKEDTGKPFIQPLFRDDIYISDSGKWTAGYGRLSIYECCYPSSEPHAFLNDYNESHIENTLFASEFDLNKTRKKYKGVTTIDTLDIF